MTALRTPADIDTKPAGLAGKDCTGGFPLFGDEPVGRDRIVIGIQPDFLNRRLLNGITSRPVKRRGDMPVLEGSKMDIDQGRLQGLVSHEILMVSRSAPFS